MCDLAVAADSARFAMPGVNIGIFCSTPAVGVARNVGRKRAMELLLTGEMVDAREALRLGLVNRVVPAPRLLEEAEGLLRKMIANAPISLRLTLQAVTAGLDLPLGEAQKLEAALFGLTCATEDMKEGTRAFLEKRPPAFQGR
jgi:enoyl-CoA hydratase/carnithine racemase